MQRLNRWWWFFFLIRVEGETDGGPGMYQKKGIQPSNKGYTYINSRYNQISVS
jgi:hypothetical protein